MVQATILKMTCFQCKIKHWVASFGKESYKDLSSISVCLFCKMQKANELIDKQMKEIKNELEKIKATDKAACNGVSDERASDRPASIKKVDCRVNTLQHDVAMLTCIVNKHNSECKIEQTNLVSKFNAFKLVSGSRACPRATVCEPASVAVANRFDLLQDETETILIGSSMVRDQGKHFSSKNAKKRINKCYPGAKIKNIVSHVNELRIKGKQSRIITMVGSNDIFSFDKKERSTEVIYKDFVALTDSLNDKTENAVMVGVLPRLRENHIQLSKAIGLNERVKKMCQEKGITFLDYWNDFFDISLFAKDGVHLNYVGKEKLGKLLNESVLNLIRKSSMQVPNQKNIDKDLGKCTESLKETYVNLDTPKIIKEKLVKKSMVQNESYVKLSPYANSRPKASSGNEMVMRAEKPK